MNTEDTSADHDRLSRFLLTRTGVRGALVRLNATWDSILGRSDYPAAVAGCLGETCAAAAIFTSAIKFQGRLSVQLSGQGALRTLFAECTTAGTLRAIAHHGPGLPDRLTPRAFGPGALMAISIENRPSGARDVQRYQGLVGLDADNLSDAFEDYFRQSEQLPTRLRLLARPGVAAALMIQLLPDQQRDADAWARATALMATLDDEELASLPGRQLVWRLFHEEAPEWLGDQPLSFACSCSRERVADMLVGLGREEALAGAERGRAEIHCDFCGQAYIFDREDIRHLFDPPTGVPGPMSLQ